MDNDTLTIAHFREAEEQGAEFHNLGWATGDDFIHSKTSIGRLYSEIDKSGKVTHEWQKPYKCVLCGATNYGFGNNPDPLARKGMCCDGCNATKVIPARLQPMNSQDLTECKYPAGDCLIIGKDNGYETGSEGDRYFTDSGYLTDSQVKAHNKWHKAQ